MFKLAVLTSILTAACASSPYDRSTAGFATDTAPHARIQFDPSATGDSAIAVFPAARQLAAPSVDRVANLVRARLGETAIAELDLCVSTDGHVSKVELARGSSFAMFDSALVRDAESWQFERLPGPATLQSCMRTTIAYRSR